VEEVAGGGDSGATHPPIVAEQVLDVGGAVLEAVEAGGVFRVSDDVNGHLKELLLESRHG